MLTSLLTQKQLFEMADILGGIPVLSCVPGSPSAEAGIGYGDIILSVNGMKVTSIDQYAEARKLITGKVEVVLWRNGKELAYQLEFPSDNG